MQIEQAYFGEIRNGHALRAASGDKAFAAQLAFRLDIPDTAPQGIAWLPFLRGFPFSNRYILARTMVDVEAARAGMVFSHALIAPLDEFIAITDLRPLIAALQTTPTRDSKISSMDYQIACGPVSEATDDLLNTCDALLAAKKEPVVRIGQERFDELIAALWARLWPDFRRGFAFRLSFSPRDWVDTPMPALINAPKSLVAPWPQGSIISSEPRERASSLASAALCGEESGGLLLQFRDDTGAHLEKLADLNLLEAAYQLSEISPQTFERIVSSLRIIEKLSPNSSEGNRWKGKKLENLCRLLVSASPSDVLILRNLSLTSIMCSGRIWMVLEKWEASNRCPPSDDSDMSRIVEDSLDSTKAIAEWRNAVLSGFASALRARCTEFIHGLWRWLQLRPSLATGLLDYVPLEQATESTIAELTPESLPLPLAETIMRFAVSRNWFCLHGAVAAAALTPLDATRRQLAVDLDSNSTAGLRFALRWAKPDQILSCACTLSDSRLTELASDCSVTDPSLLRELNFSSEKVQMIWAKTLSRNPGAWRGPEDPKLARDTVLNCLLDSGSAETALIAQLASSPLADLSDFPRREEIWSHLESRSRRGFLRATALGWLKSLAGGSINFAPESGLAEELLETSELRSTLIDLVPRRIGLACQAIEYLEGMGEVTFIQWLQALWIHTLTLEPNEAESIGRLIMDRRWQRSVQELTSVYRKGRNDVMAAIRQVVPLLDFWDRIFLKITSPSEDEWWGLLASICAELYPSGPDHNELWARAGGKNSELNQVGNGGARWHDALTRVRYGGGVSARKLLGEMKREFPTNPRLKYLAEGR